MQVSANKFFVSIQSFRASKSSIDPQMISMLGQIGSMLILVLILMIITYAVKVKEDELWLPNWQVCMSIGLHSKSWALFLTPKTL